LVLLSTPLMLKGDWRGGIRPLLRYVVPWYYPLEEANLDDPFVQHRIREHAPEIDLSDPAVREQVRRQVRLPMGAIDELRKALRHARAYVPTVCVPTLVMHGIEDDVAPPASADELMMRLGSSDKQIVWWDRTGHYLLFDGPHRDAIYRRVAMFLLSDEDERV
jgi:esterase/lipase